MTRATKCLVLVAALALGACGKKAGDSGGSETSGATPPTPPPGGATGEVQRYPDEVPFGGTRRTLVSFTIYQQAAEGSTVLSRVGPGTLINLKASHSSWMLIEYPSGVGQLSLGWINLDRHDSSKVQDVNTVDAGTPVPDAGTPVDAGAPVDAGKPAGVIRPTVKIKPKSG